MMDADNVETVHIPEQILDVASTLLKGRAPAEIKYFVSATDFIQREVIRQIAEEWSEIVHVAEQFSDNGEKPKLAALTANIKIDLSNLDMLKVSVATAVKSFQMKREAETSEDLRQLSLDLDGRAVTRQISEELAPPPPENQTEATLPVKGAGYTRESLEEMKGDELREIAGKLNLQFKSKSKNGELVDMILAHYENPEGSNSTAGEPGEDTATE